VTVALEGEEAEAVIAVKRGKVGWTTRVGLGLAAVVVDHDGVRAACFGTPDAAVEFVLAGREVNFFGRRGCCEQGARG
jgi:hypothetical protein